jgi:hypothetical protein
MPAITAACLAAGLIAATLALPARPAAAGASAPDPQAPPEAPAAEPQARSEEPPHESPARLAAPDEPRAFAPAPDADLAEPTEVRVERVKPRRIKHQTLRFLKENRDFIRGRFDRLRERPLAARGDAAALDPRFLAYRDMLAAILADGDSVSRADDARARRELLASVTELGALEDQLDQLERLLAEQRGRLGQLQANFTGDQRTELMVVVSGNPGVAAPAELSVALEDGATLVVRLGEAERAALRDGGVVQVLHSFVEPREQSVEVGLRGGAWPAGDTGWITLDPPRDRLTLLKLDLSALDAARGAAGIRASTWTHDARPPSIDG